MNQPIRTAAVVLALAVSALGYIVEAIERARALPGIMAAALILFGAWYLRQRMQESSNAERVHRVTLCIALLALLHSSGFDQIDAWIGW